MGNITINIQNLVGKIEVNSENQIGCHKKITELVSTALVSAVKDAEVQLNSELSPNEDIGIDDIDIQRKRFINQLHELGVLFSFELTEEAKASGYYLPFSHDHNYPALHKLLCNSNVDIKSITKSEWTNAQ